MGKPSCPSWLLDLAGRTCSARHRPVPGHTRAHAAAPRLPHVALYTSQWLMVRGLQSGVWGLTWFPGSASPVPSLHALSRGPRPGGGSGSTGGMLPAPASWPPSETTHAHHWGGQSCPARDYTPLLSQSPSPCTAGVSLRSSATRLVSQSLQRVSKKDILPVGQRSRPYTRNKATGQHKWPQPGRATSQGQARQCLLLAVESQESVKASMCTHRRTEPMALAARTRGRKGGGTLDGSRGSQSWAPTGDRTGPGKGGLSPQT